MTLQPVLLCGLLLALAAPLSAQTSKFVKFPNGPKIDFTIPMGYSFDARNNRDGSVGIKMENPIWGIVIYAIIANERRAEATKRDWQQSTLISHIAQHLSRASETDYDFKPLNPVKGTGLYCVFSAAGAEPGGPVRPGQSSHVTGGIKSWPGCVVLFHIFSNDVTSPEYQEAFDLFNASFTE